MHKLIATYKDESRAPEVVLERVTFDDMLAAIADLPQPRDVKFYTWHTARGAEIKINPLDD